MRSARGLAAFGWLAALAVLGRLASRSHRGLAPLSALAAALATALARSALAYDLDPGPGAHGGTVFRQDEIEDRDFDFSDEHFGQVLAFRHPLDLVMSWKRWREEGRRAPYAAGYRVNVGSLTNEDFYLEQEAYASITAFEGRLRGRYRLVMDEDFDSRFVKNLVEVDAFVVAGLYAGATAALDADKEFIDFGLALGYEHDWFALRLDAVFADLTWNDKSAEDARFRRYQRSFVARAEARPTDEIALGAFVEVSTPFELESFERGFRFGMVKDRVGGYALWESKDLLLGLEVGYESTRKRRIDTGQSVVGGDARTERDALFLDVRARFALDDDERLFLDGGAHLIWLDETVRAALPEERAFDDRVEGYLSAGLHWRPAWFDAPLDRAFALTPTLFLGLRDVADEREDERRFVANLSPRLEIFPTERWRIILNPMMHLHDLSFGGGNVQVAFSF